MAAEEEVKEKLKEMFPEYKGFIQHTLVSSMCLSYYKEASKELVEALSSFVEAIENESVIYQDNIDLDGFATIGHQLYTTAKKALEKYS